MGLIPGLRRSPRAGDPLLQYSCLENGHEDRGFWWVTVRGANKESDMTEQLSTCLLWRSVYLDLLLKMAQIYYYKTEVESQM